MISRVACGVAMLAVHSECRMATVQACRTQDKAPDPNLRFFDDRGLDDDRVILRGLGCHCCCRHDAIRDDGDSGRIVCDGRCRGGRDGAPVVCPFGRTAVTNDRDAVGVAAQRR
jgi:hypothetical protein